MKTFKLSLSSKEIVNKVFSGAPRGYSPFEVDEYLDKILKDYILVERNVLIDGSQMDEKDKKINELNEKIKALELENHKFKSKLEGISPSANVSSDNIKLLKKIDAYEKFIHKMGYNPNNIS